MVVLLAKHLDFPQNVEYFFGHKNHEKLRGIWEITGIIGSMRLLGKKILLN